MSSTTRAETSTDRLHLLGIRHHGPGSARSVRKALDALRPDVVLLEAPADAAAALTWIGHAGLVPPVALLGYVVAAPQRAVFAPLAAFSPEWQTVHVGGGERRRRRADRPAAGDDARRSLVPRRRPRATHRPIRSATWRRPPANRTRSGGGRTSSSTAATANRSSTPSLKRWPPPAQARGRRRRTSSARRTCAGASAARWQRTPRWRSSAARGTSRRCIRVWRPPALTPRRCAGGARRRLV